MRGMSTKGMDFETDNLRDIKTAGYETPMARLQRNACFDKEAAVEHKIPGSNLSISGFGRDLNGNSIVYVNTPNQRRKSIQTNGYLPQTYSAGRDGMEFFDTADPDKIAKVEQEILGYVQQFGTPAIKERLKLNKEGAKKKVEEPIEEITETVDNPEEELQEAEEPSEGDYVLQPTGPLGSKIGLSEVGGSYLGTFSDEEEAAEFIRKRMEEHKFYPSTWFVSDHGNISPFELTASKKTAMFEVDYLLSTEDDYKIEKGFQSKEGAEKWAKANNIEERSEDWDIYETPVSKTAGVPEQHQLSILKDTVRNPAKGMFLGGPTAEEAEKTLKEKFGYTEEQIKKLKASKKTAGILADIMNGQNRIPTKQGEKAIMGVSAIIHNNMPVEEIADVLMNGEQRMKTLRGEKSVKDIVAMLEADREANPNSYVPIVGVEAAKKTSAIYDGYGYRVTIEAKAGDYNESYTPITGMLKSADIRYREVKRYTIDPDRMLMDILVTKEDIDVIQELNKQSKETGISFTFNDNISEAIKPKQITTDSIASGEFKKDKPTETK